MSHDLSLEFLVPQFFDFLAIDSNTSAYSDRFLTEQEEEIEQEDQEMEDWGLSLPWHKSYVRRPRWIAVRHARTLSVRHHSRDAAEAPETEHGTGPRGGAPGRLWWTCSAAKPSRYSEEAFA